ncbi:MAG TPA: FUSC family protein [Bryobacteraceae bacterium]|nr:FUSC family protein [Bryobacteraceae bacterium]
MTAAPPASFSQQTWAQRLWLDLQPAPGRLAGALRITLATVIALILMMVWQLPFASLGLYYIFLVVRESPATSVRMGVIAILTIVLAVAAELAVVILTDNDPGARLLSVAVAAFLAGVLMVASSFPAFAAIWGFIYCTLIALWELPAPANALVKASLYVVATVTLAFLCSVAVEYLFAFRKAADRLLDQMNLRYKTVEGVFTLFAKGAPPAQLGAAIAGLNRLAATGQRGMLELYNAAIERDQGVDKLPAGARGRIVLLAQFTDVAAAFASQQTAGVAPNLRGRCAEIARLCHERKSGEAPGHVLSDESPGLLDRVDTALHTLLSMPAGAMAAGDEELAALPSSKMPFLIPGAVSNKDTIAYALKLTLSVMICYVFYFAVAWPGISTSVTTVFLVALGNTGAIKQKMFNRFVGSAIGGGLAILATAFLFPRMDSLTSLVVLIAVVAFGSAWWAGGRQFGYGGFQIAFSFYLVAFEGFSAPAELAPARDRLVGIMVALVVIWFVYDQLWPVRTVTAMRRALVAVLKCEARFLRLFESDTSAKVRLAQVDGIRDQLAKTIAGMRGMNDAVVYEFGLDRDAHIRAGEAVLQAALTAVPFFWNQLAILQREEDRDFLTEPALMEMRRKVAAHLDAMAQSVAAGAVIVPVSGAELVAAQIVQNPRYGEYARNTIAAHEELQSRVANAT